MAPAGTRAYFPAMKVHEIMSTHARCIGPENSLVEAAGLMRSLDVGALPVCDEDRLAGMLTDRDIVVRAVADGRDPGQTTVRDAMSPGIVYTFADAAVEDAARVMEEKQLRRLPVLNREKRLVGIVSLGDLALGSSPAFSGQALRDISEPAHPTARQRRLASASQPAFTPRIRTDGDGQAARTERPDRKQPKRQPAQRTTARKSIRRQAKSSSTRRKQRSTQPRATSRTRRSSARASARR